MRRRTFIATLGGTAAAWPVVTLGQPGKVVPVIGFLGASSLAIQSQWVEAFVKRLGELGWIEGRTVSIEYRWAEGRSDRAPEVMAEFARRKVDVIVTHGLPNVLAAKNATTAIPIVFALLGDPVANGVVASLARPGGNVTGFSMQSSDVAGKRIQFLREIVPGIRRLGCLGASDNASFAPELAEVRKVTDALGIELVVPDMLQYRDVVPAIERLESRVDALYFQSSPRFNEQRVQINTLALSLRLPTGWSGRGFLDGGGLTSYGPDYADLFSRTAGTVDRILRGANPADIPVQQPTKWEFVINMKTAKALGLTIPPAILARADEVIE